ncbi:type 2 lanthipeptide synthetase LanM [Tenacibaculum amylolyticum]|uniref:type 2 lanthipeptide synthetase LanM n=1 Tax=Tenacibaculum amylolyticum TaxID=104269 RepID=UPI0038963B92
MDLLVKNRNDKALNSVRERLLNVIAKATSIEERIQDSFVRLDTNKTNHETLKKEWIHTIAKGSEKSFKKWLSFMNWSEDDFFNALQENVSIQDETNLPKWAITLLQLFLELEDYYAQEKDIIYHVENNETHNILFPFIKIAEKHVINESDRLELGITYTSGSEMVTVFKHRLTALTVSLLDTEIYLNNITAAFQTDTTTNNLNSFDSWLSRIETYPVIAKLIALTYLNWSNAITEFIERLSKDKKHISKTFFNGEDLGLLLKYSGDAGDVHCDGRSVALLTFENGKKLVYKPKDLSIANSYFSLLKELNPQLSLKLSTRKIDVRDSYTWEEFITYKECTNINQFKDFYKRLGMITRLFQLLGARDFWLDNLIAHGSQPVFIDLEMVIQNFKKDENDLLSTEQAALHQIEESAVKIGIVSMPTPIGFGVKFEDLGTLTPIKKFSSPFKFDLTTTDQLGFEMEKSKDGYISWEKDDYLPRVGGTYAKSSDYMTDFLDGYEEMNTVLTNNKTKLLAKDSPIHLFDHALLRYIHRDTWTYMRLIKNSYHPQALINGIVQDKYLFSLYSEIWNEDNSLNKNMAYVIDHEVSSILNLDVPLFNAVGGNCNLPTSKGIAHNYFDYSSKELIVKRLKNIKNFNVLEHKNIILSNYFGGSHEQPKVTYNTSLKSKLTIEDWTRLSKECAQMIINQAITNDKTNEKSWIGIDYHPEMDANMLAVLKPDIFSGTCGLSMLFTDLYRAFKDSIYKEFAIGSLQSTLGTIEKSLDKFNYFTQEWYTSSKPFIVGAYMGIGSQVIALEYCSKYIEDTNLKTALAYYLSVIPYEKLVENASSGFITGYPGLLFSLINYVDNDKLLALSHAEHKNIRCIPDEAAVKTELQDSEMGIKYLQFLLGEKSNLIANETSSTTLSDLLIQLEYLALNKNDKALIKRFETFLSTQPKELKVTELIAYADLSLNLYRILKDEKYYDLATLFAEEIVSRKLETKEWFSDIWASENYYLSVLYGTGALSHLFLRLSQKGKFGSFRQLSTFKNI